MPYCRLTLASPYGPPTIKVQGIHVICSIRVLEDGVNFTVYDGNDSGFAPYLFRDRNASTLHRINGSFSVSCYDSQTFNRPVDKVAFARNVLEIFNTLVNGDMIRGYNDGELPCKIINVPVSTAIGGRPPVATIREAVYTRLMNDEPLDVGSAGGAYFTHYDLGASGYYFENIAEGPFFDAPLEST
ncbi:hypothetical protein BD770DRAFT_477010 [Pilaira anomala]|nr:hypothetical protein BD770DRAFT_477010 [Pilaira anomala]